MRNRGGSLGGFSNTARDGSAYVMNEFVDSSLANCLLYHPMTPRYYSECDSLPGRLALGCSPIGIEELGNPFSKLIAFPSPAYEYLELNFVSEDFATIVIDIFDIVGQKVMERKENVEPGNQALNLNVGKLTSGIYLVSLRKHSGNLLQEKFIKQ